MHSATSVNLHNCHDRCRGGAFTLVELLVVIAIISLLLGILLPALLSAQRKSRMLVCATNMRQVCTALLAYANDHGGAFPPNADLPPPGRYWYDRDRAGSLFSAATGNPTGGTPRVLTCPDDSGGRRSYAMNIYASSQVDAWTLPLIAQQGTRWRATVGQGSKMILLVETWSTTGSEALGWFAPPAIGLAGSTPGQRFGAGGGIQPPISAGRYGQVTCELSYSRHSNGRSANPNIPTGWLNIGYADGHVAARTERDLANFETGRSTLDSLWSPVDADHNK